MADYDPEEWLLNELKVDARWVVKAAYALPPKVFSEFSPSMFAAIKALQRTMERIDEEQV